MTLFGPSKPYVDRVVPADEIARAIKRTKQREAEMRMTGSRRMAVQCHACGASYYPDSIKHWCRK